MKINNQQRSSEQENVQRLEQQLVAVKGETENTLPSEVEGEDIVQNLRGSDKLISKEEFLKRAYKKYGNKFTFDLTNYKGLTKSKIIIFCPIHGEFTQMPHTFLLNQCVTGCMRCGKESTVKTRTKSYDEFLDDVNLLYNNQYDYVELNRSKFKDRKSKIEIICKKHGIFIKSGQKHLSGQGCSKCNTDKLIKENILVGGYSENLFNNNLQLKDKKACLYYISINKGRLYKIGISTSLENRMRGIRSKAKTFIKSMELLWTVEDTLYNCFKKEQEILNKYSDKRVFFKWSTELFNEDILPIRLEHLN